MTLKDWFAIQGDNRPRSLRDIAHERNAERASALDADKGRRLPPEPEYDDPLPPAPTEKYGEFWEQVRAGRELRGI
jgi:hypothetical protein